MYDRLQLTNMLRSEVERIPETGLPLEVFPARIQELVLNLARYENFNVEYTASILLSAVATAIGNSCRIRIKGEWKTSPSIYMMLVGRPGLGKTPPLGFLYKPIREHDDRMYEKYNEEWDAYEKALASSGTRRGGEAEDCTLLRKPQLVTTVISDFTPEAMMSIHQHNPRGIALVVDEIRALFNSVKRYNNRNNLIEDLLTAYSGQPLKVIRKSEARPILIRNPCINIIGSVQPNLLPEIFRAEYMTNGLLDRFLFVYPKDRRISGWKRDDGAIARPDMVGQWREVLGNTFTAGDAIVAGKRVELSRRSVYYALKQLCSQPNPLLEKIDHGTYRKLCPSKPAAPCTIALSDGETGGAGGQSAKVQCANDENPRGHE